MKKIVNFIIIAIALSTLTSCEDWLDKLDSSNTLLTEDDIFSDPYYIENFAFRMYDCTGIWFETAWGDGERNAWWWMDGQHRGKLYASVQCATGEIISYRSGQNNINKVIPGLWQDLVNASATGTQSYYNDFGPLWAGMWEMIYVANMLIARIPDVPLTVLTQEEKDQYLGEAYAFRAMGYFEIFRRWGAVPYIAEKMTATVDMDIPGTPVLEMATYLAADCDMAASLLSTLVYQTDSPYFGRIGRSAALGVKSTILTAAASPLFNTDNDPSWWKLAAEAAWDVIEESNNNPTIMGLYDATAGKDAYKRIFIGEPITIEAVWPRWYAEQDYQAWTLTWFWSRKSSNTSLDSQQVGFAPTQELVDRFETTNGMLPKESGNTLYDTDDPYANRDPRFYASILYHGAEHIKMSETDNIIDMTQSSTAGIYTDMVTNPTAGVHDGNSATGYLVGKMNTEKCNNTTYTTETYYFNTPRIRMAEIYLNYAEAMNEYEGPKAAVTSGALTAEEALNAVRNRAGHVDIPSTYTASQELFRERVKNEFWVELCFEDHLFHDVRRWKDGPDYLNGRQFKGMMVTVDSSKPTGYAFEEFTLPQVTRVFEEKHLLLPFRTSDLKIYANLVQNPGW